MKQTVVLLSALIAVVSAAAVHPPLTTVDIENGDAVNGGRVAVQVQGNSEMLQVCSNGFNANEANAVCRTLQFNQGTVLNGQFGLRSGTQLVSLSCGAGVTTISECTYQTPTECTSIAGVKCSSKVGATGTLALEGGIIGAILVCLVAIIGIGIGLGVCLYRNDLCNCFGQRTPSL